MRIREVLKLGFAALYGAQTGAAIAPERFDGLTPASRRRSAAGDDGCVQLTPAQAAAWVRTVIPGNG
jgi:hypothetical protein